MGIQKSYTYIRKDGGTTDCFGSLEEDSNFDLACEDEMKDIIWADGAQEGSFQTWREVCIHLEQKHSFTIEQIIAC